MKKIIQPYYVIIWDFNRKNIKYYDIMPYLLDEYKSEKKSKHKTFGTGKFEIFDDYKTFILNASKYRFWSRCEYEIIVGGFPFDQYYTNKIDIYDQISVNIDVITNHFINQL